MAGNSAIEWTGHTWNPITGCTKISAGCRNCYAERIAHRLQSMGQPRYVNGFKVTIHPDALSIPLKWKKPRLVFVNSMSDMFHEDVPFEFVLKIFKVMEQASHHIFQILTKRSEYMMEMSPQIRWPSNVWMGISAENSDNLYRIDHLRQTSATVKFISFEPLLGPIYNIDYTGVDWVIVGGESGPKARAISPVWVESIRIQSENAGVPFFFKQWGGKNKKKAGRELNGKIWNEMPALTSPAMLK